MQRLLVTETGDCFARFHDKSTVFLSSSCHIAVETDSNNKQITHIIQFINDSLKQKVTQIIHIRNQYYSSLCLPPFMMQTKGDKQLLSPLNEAIWTPQCQQNIQNQTIQSEDRCVALELHKNEHKLSISFPLYINKQITVTQHGSPLIFYHHIKQTQIQSIHNHNLCWDFPLSLVQKQSEMNPNNALNVRNTTRIPQIQQHSLQKTVANLTDECMKAIEYFHCSDHGIPANEIIIIEWTVHTVHRIFNAPNYLIETFIEFDDSYLVSNHEDNAFMFHYVPRHNEDTSEYIYSVKAIPPIPPDTNQESSYDLQMIGEQAFNLLQNAHTLHAYKQTKTARNLPLESKKEECYELNGYFTRSMSNEVKDYYIHPKFGEFTYFEDKRVKIHFSDRTLLELNGERTSCSIITKYGEEIKNVDCINPTQRFRVYIRHALNYANWCRLSKQQQIQHQEMQLKLQNDIEKQINFSQRLVETQRMTQEQDFSTLYKDDAIMSINDQVAQGNNNNMDNNKLIDSIRDQLNDIDKLLQ
eukprot:34711_1